MLALIWGGLLVMRLVAPMLGGEWDRPVLRTRVLVSIGVVLVSGFLLDLGIHGRF